MVSPPKTSWIQNATAINPQQSMGDASMMETAENQ